MSSQGMGTSEQSGSKMTSSGSGYFPLKNDEGEKESPVGGPLTPDVAVILKNSSTAGSTDYIVGGMPEDGPPSSWAGFSDMAIRQAFIRKVYAILMLQLAFTFGLTALFVYEKRVQNFVKSNFSLYIAAYITFFVVYLVLVCSTNLRRKWPANMVLLSLFTVAMSYMVATMASFNDYETVLIAAGITACCCLAITIFSINTKYDITSCGGVLFICCWVMFMFGILAIVFYSRILQITYASLGALLFMLFLAYDTQLIVGGKQYSISPEEHIFAALQLYLDVVYIFIYILTILGGGRK